jgi:cell shape-determining protein MreC
MSQVRFNHLFLGLMGGGVVCAFLIPPWITVRAQGKVDGLLYPVAKPVRSVAEGLHSRFGKKGLPPGETRVRGDSELAEENARLRQQVAFLHAKLDELRYVEAERKRMGELLDFCTPVAVMAGDSSLTRDSIVLAPLSGVSVPAGTPVLYADGLVGKVVDGSRVRLITDRNYTIVGGFGRWKDGNWVKIQTPRPTVVGMGQGRMVVNNLSVDEAKGLEPGDWVIIDDEESYPGILQGRKIGQVESVKPMASKPLFAEIIVRPKIADLRRLREVMVLTGRRK